MILNKTLITTATLAGALALGACTATINEPVRGPALQNTKAGKLPAGRAPGTLPSGHRMSGAELSVKFRGRRTRFTDMQGRPLRASAWRMRGDTYCGRWPNRGWRCYEVYATGPNRYTLWFGGRAHGRVSVH